MAILAYPISQTAGAYKIPKAGSDGKIAAGYIPDLSATYQPKDATLTALAAFNTNGLLTQTAADTFSARTLAGGTGIGVTNGDGVSGNPTIAIDSTVVTLAGSQTLTNKTLTAPTIAKIGNLTSNGFVKTSSGDGTLSIDTSTYLTANQTITLSGDASGSGATSIAVTLATVNSNVGSFDFPTITVNGKGLITAVATTVKLALARGGTNADLSATGGTSQVLKQTSAGGAITVGQLSNSDVSGLGTMATQNASSVSITGGSATGLSSVTISSAGQAFNASGQNAPSASIAQATSTSLSALVDNLSLARNPVSGTPLAGFGQALPFLLKSSTTSSRRAAEIDVLWNTATDSGAIADLVLSAAYNPSGSPTMREGLRIRGGSSATQVGFFGATSVAQPATMGTTSGFTAGSGTTVHDDSTFTGGTGSTAYRVSDIVLALKQLGLLAA